ncbi:MAG: hypothetical protein K1000chlam2_01573 [Chlamydiae bacterium]|nr:hypothetical protein [Chlamydiota bacterium]
MSEELFDEMIALQEEKVFKLAEKIVPRITREDVLQPNDFPALENHPFFRYEEGVLEGLRSAKMAYVARKQ